METNQQFTNENRRRNLNDDPQYFGAYLNLARLNIFSINNHLAEEFKITTLEEDGRIQSGFICESNKKNFNYNWLFEKLIRLMPVVKQFDAARLPKEEQKNIQTEGKNLVKMAETLKAVFKDIQEFRNDYTHYYSTETGDKRKLSVSQTTANFLKLSFERAIAYTRSRFESVFADEDFTLITQKELIRNDNTVTSEGLVFLTCMFLDRENAFQFIGKIQGLKGTQFKSFVATREVLMAYCVRLPHDKLISDDPQQAFLLDILNELDRCPKLLYNVLDDEAKKEFRPILTESGIENVLKNSLNDEAREEYLDTIDYGKYLEQLTVRVRHSNRFYYYAMRFIDDRNLLPDFFFQIDLGKYLLADYNKKIMGEEVPRAIIENAKAFGKLSTYDSPDVLQQRIDPDGLARGFEQFAPHYNTDINKVGFRFNQDICTVEPVQPKANGNLTVNLVQPQPLGFLSLHELSKIILLEYLQPGESMKLIREFFNTANKKLFNLEFIQSVKNQLAENNWNTFYKQCDRKKSRAYMMKGTSDKKEFRYDALSRKKALDVVLAPHGLNHKQIPERILNYWLHIQDVNDSRNIAERILLMKRDGLKRLKQLKKHSQDPGVRIPKVGEMATFIARDIVDMVIDKDKKQKITSIYYDKMQECLAFYADRDKKQQFIGLVRELNLNAPGGHPFLKNLRLESIRKTSQFYREYLQEKVDKTEKVGLKRDGKPKFQDVSWLTKTFESKEWSDKAEKYLTVFKLPDNRVNIPYTIRQWDEKEQYDLEAWLRNINQGRKEGDQKRPIDLPTNLFDEKLCELLANKLRAAGHAVPDKAKYNELLKCWWQTRDDSTQSFYNGKRLYIIKEEEVSFVPGTESNFKAYYQKPLGRAFERLSNKRREEKRTNPKLPDIMLNDVEKSFKRTLAETEKEIRILAEEDRLLLLIAEQLSMGEGLGQLKLKNIKEELTEIKPVSRKFCYKPNFDDMGNKPAKDQDLPLRELHVHALMQRKNSNDLNRFAHDRRLAEFVTYLPDGNITVDELRYEMTDYNKARQTVFDSVFRLEKTIVEKDIRGLEKLFTDQNYNQQQGNISFKPYMQWLINNGYITQNERSYLEVVRNCFSHNQFPPHSIVELFTKSGTLPALAGRIAEAYKLKIDEILLKLY
jgi:hypothetical protein